MVIIDYGNNRLLIVALRPVKLTNHEIAVERRQNTS